MRRNLLLVHFSLGAIFLWGMISGCADDPSPVGTALIPSSDLVGVDSVIVIASGSFSEKAVPVSFASPRTSFAIGKHNGFESWGLLLFYSLPDSLASVTVQSAELRIVSSYTLGNAAGMLSVIPHAALVDWNSNLFTFDSLKRSGIYDPAGIEQQLGSFGAGTVVTISLDTAMVGGWLRSVVDTGSHNYGVILEPTNSTVIRGFASVLADSATDQPSLLVQYTRAGSAQVDTVVLTTLVDKFVAAAADTSFLSDNASMSVRSGASYRGVISLDLSPLPAHAAIHRAFLDIVQDSAASFFATGEHDSLLALYGGAQNPIQLSRVIAESGNKVFRFTVTEFVQAMIQKIGDSKIHIATFDEENSVGLFRLYGAGAASALKPRITILYSPTN